MDRRYANHRYRTTPPVSDRKAGCTTLHLHCETDGQTIVVAEVVYWDAAPGYFLKTFDEILVEIVEELIAEAKEAIPYK